MRRNVLGIADREIEQHLVTTKFDIAIGQFICTPTDNRRRIGGENTDIGNDRWSEISLRIGRKLHDLALNGSIIAQIRRLDLDEIRARRAQIGQGDLVHLACGRELANKTQPRSPSKLDNPGRVLIGAPLNGGNPIILIDHLRLCDDSRRRQVQFGISAKDRLSTFGGTVANRIDRANDIVVNGSRRQVAQDHLVVEGVGAQTHFLIAHAGAEFD